MVEYEKYLKSGHWKEFRKRFLARKKPKGCWSCGRKGRLDLHHVTYERLGRERIGDVVAICRTCHDEVHDLHDRGKAKNLQSATDKIRQKYRAQPPPVFTVTVHGKARKIAWRAAKDSRQSMDEAFNYALEK